MARARGLCCLLSPIRAKPSDADTRRRRSAACICCIGPHHKPSAPDADLSVRLPLTGCCGSGGDARGRSSARTPRTPRTPCTPTARRLCGVRSRTPRRGQVCCFPAPHAAAAPAAPASAPVAAAAAVSAATATARTPRTPRTPLGRPQRVCCVRVPAQSGNAKLGMGRRRRWFRSARKALAPTTPRFPGAGRGGKNIARGNNDGVTVYETRVVEVEAAAAMAEEETCSNDEYALLCREGFSREDVAAVTIQAYFRGHLARRAFRALKSLVRLQAVARGAYVRRQAEAAMNCMKAMARLQARVRARQMLAKPDDKEGLLLQS